MFLALFSLSFSSEYTISAVHKNGKIIDWASFSLDSTTKSITPDLLFTDEFVPDSIKEFQIILPDGGKITTPAFGRLEDLRFQLFLNSKNEPISFKIVSSKARKQRFQDNRRTKN